MKKTLVIGASTKPERYSNMAANKLLKYGHEVALVGKREGKVSTVKILVGKPLLENIDTVTIYLNAQNQKEYYEYIFQLKPKRIIFNPGAENPELAELAEAAGIETIEACTLVMLSIGNF